MLGLGLSLNKLSTLMGIIRKGLQMWLGFTENTASNVSINSINLESRFASTVVGIVNPVVVEGPREISFDDTHYEFYDHEVSDAVEIYAQDYPSAYIAAGTIVTLSGNITQRDSTSTWNGLDFNSDGYLEFRLSTNTIVKVYIDAAHSAASDGSNIDATTGFFSVSFALLEGAEKFGISAYDIQANDESDPGPGVRISNLSLSSLSTDNVLGVELVENGDFSLGDNGDWEMLRATISGNEGYLDSTLETALLYQDILTNGLTYTVNFNVTSFNGAGSSDVINEGGGVLLTITSLGIKTLTFTHTNASGDFFFRAKSGSIYSVDNVTVKEVTQFIPDKSTNSNNAKLLTGKALSFNGNDSVDLGATFQGIKTIAFWCKTDTTANRTVLGLSSANSPYIQIVPSNNKVYVEPPIGVRLEFSFESLSTLTWHRVVISVNSSDLVECYVNSNKSTDSFTNTEDLFSFNQIGRRGSELDHWIGSLSDLQIYNVAWDSDDAAYDYVNPNNLVIDNPNATITKSNLIGYWALSEGSGNIAFDSAGLGGEDVVDGDFLFTGTQAANVTDTYWTTGLGWSIGGGVATSTVTASHSYLQQSGNYDSGKTYRVTFDIIVTSGNFKVAFIGGGSDFGATITASEIGYSVDITLSGNRSAFGVRNNDGNGVGSISNISVREVNDNDGTGVFKAGSASNGASIGATWVHNQPTIPQLGMMDWSKGSNLIEYSEDFSNSYWGKTSLVVELNSVTSPDGFNNGTKIKADATETTYRKIRSTILPADITTYTYSIYVKKAELDFFHINIQTTSFPASSSAWFDLTGFGSVAVSSSGLDSSSITDVGDGWFRCAVTATSDADDANLVSLYMSSSATTSYAGTEGEGLYIYGVQLEQSSTAGSYIGTNGSEAINATLIQNPNDVGKDVLGNSLRLREGGFNLDGSGYGSIASDATLTAITNGTIQFWLKTSDTKFSVLNGQSITEFIAKTNNDIWENGNSGTITAYRDGTTMSTSPMYDDVWHFYTFTGVNLSAWNEFYIDNLVYYEIDGIIDEILTYSSVLTPENILNNFNIGKADHVGSALVVSSTPEASAATYTGTLTEGEQLSGTYTWSNADGGAADAKFKWYRADDVNGTNQAAISGEVAITYTLDVNDVAKHIAFRALPILSNGITGLPDLSAYQAAIAANTFDFTVNTAESGTSNDDQFTLSVGSGTFLYDLTTSDGHSETGLTGNHTLTFSSSGVYSISISGQFPAFKFNNGNDGEKMVTLDNFGVYGGGSTSQDNAFRGCNNMTLNATDSGNFGSASDFQKFMFTGNITGVSFPLIDTSSATRFDNAFRQTRIANFPANLFDNCTATNFGNAFLDTILSEQSIDNILVSLDTAGQSNGTFYQSGGSAPSSVGIAAETNLTNKGWTITRTS